MTPPLDPASIAAMVSLLRHHDVALLPAMRDQIAATLGALAQRGIEDDDVEAFARELEAALKKD